MPGASLPEKFGVRAEISSIGAPRSSLPQRVPNRLCGRVLASSGEITPRAKALCRAKRARGNQIGKRTQSIIFIKMPPKSRKTAFGRSARCRKRAARRPSARFFNCFSERNPAEPDTFFSTRPLRAERIQKSGMPSRAIRVPSFSSCSGALPRSCSIRVAQMKWR